MRFLPILVILGFWGCSNDRLPPPTLFTNITKESGIHFRNDLTFTDQLNPYTYRNFYNGAGVAIGDINNDGLQDIYFAGNQVDNKLYLNEGDLSFKDISDQAGVACSDVWSTGVTFVDINADGFLDIYVCKSGNPDAPNRNNELFINNGDLTFTEKSEEFGLDIIGLSVQASFFDYDKDGDLDCYLLTNSFKSIGNYDLVKNQREIPDPQGAGNKFFINENGRFRDYSKEAGIYRSNIGFGLGITLGDFNGDSWTDIFVSNDFFERDYLYINDQHGAFTESLTDYFQSISMGSMGADFADLDNDGNPELFVTEMLPDSLNRKKTKTVFESWDKHQLNVQNGYYHQFSRNVLQKKISNGNYVEIGRLAGVAASEWSWGALLFDMDNDGLRDIFIANGIYKDLLDRDYLTYTGAAENVRKIIKEEKNAIVKLIELMPASEFPNYAFKNEGNLHFKNKVVEWGLGEPMFSSGSAYGDLDNDGDLDLVVNNINAESILYKNNSDSANLKSISLLLTSQSSNTFVVGAEVIAYYGTSTFFSDNFVTRGFQSSVQPMVTIGLGSGVKTIDSILIRWPDRGHSVIYNIATNQKLTIVKEDQKIFDLPSKVWNDEQFHLERVDSTLFRHKGSGLIDFNRDRLLPFMYSNETPTMLRGDINSDGIEEIYVGGGKDQSGSFIQFKQGKWESINPNTFSQYTLTEETKGALVDIDKDGDLDLYLASGGRFYSKISSVLADKIFLNNGKGEFSESPKALPFADYFSTSVVKPIDFDNDGDFDLLVGERFDPFYYGVGGRGFLLENDGAGLFNDVTKQYASALSNLGMITGLEIQDFDNDGWNDIIIIGDWMPIVVLKNERKNFIDFSQQLGLSETQGWWHDIESGDFNKDGKVDFVIGNNGLNTFFRTDDRMYVSDFDKNGSIEQIFCTKVNGKYYPVADKDEFLSQLPSLKKELLYYKDYARKSMEELFPQSILANSKIFQVKLLASIMLLSGTNGYELVELPLEAQFSPIYSLLIADFDNDGVDDLIVGGNQYAIKPQFGRNDASNGWFFKGRLSEGKFEFQTGIDLDVKGQIRDIEYVELNGIKYILFAKYDDDLEVYKVSN
ncbi:MAG TPA: VCBS repeat-containing protein [Cyclobacteriaceae bacterium]|nr:VCBS repeat-containing protein [Cyclobacteriaceae bacterium]